MTWDEAVAVALELPATELSTSYSTPAVKVKKALLMRLKEDGASVVLLMGHDEKGFLMEAAPEVFFQTPHYEGYPAILARLPLLQPEELRRIVTRTWRSKAPKALVKALDAEAEA